jgi:hypothetical protein
MNPTVTKPWYASAGVWGALVTLASSVLALLKVEVDPQVLGHVREGVLALATLVGGAVALWGRVRATRRIGAGAAPAQPQTARERARSMAAVTRGCDAP